MGTLRVLTFRLKSSATALVGWWLIVLLLRLNGWRPTVLASGGKGWERRRGPGALRGPWRYALTQL